MITFTPSSWLFLLLLWFSLALMLLLLLILLPEFQCLPFCGAQPLNSSCLECNNECIQAHSKCGSKEVCGFATQLNNRTGMEIGTCMDRGSEQAGKIVGAVMSFIIRILRSVPTQSRHWQQQSGQVLFWKSFTGKSCLNVATMWKPSKQARTNHFFDTFQLLCISVICKSSESGLPAFNFLVHMYIGIVHGDYVHFQQTQQGIYRFWKCIT